MKPISEGPFTRYLNGWNYNCFEHCLSGITNDSKDPSVDTFKSTALPILKRFGVPSEGLELKIESRGLPPNGGGEVILSLPVVQSLSVSFWFFWWFRLFKLCCYHLMFSSWQAVSWIDEGFVKKIRGTTFSTRVSVQFENSMIKATRGIVNPLVSDVHIFSDHRSGPQAGKYDSFHSVEFVEYWILILEIYLVVIVKVIVL